MEATEREIIVVHPAKTVNGHDVSIIEIAPTYLYGRVKWHPGGHSYYSWNRDGTRRPTVGDSACTDSHYDPLDLDLSTLP